MKILKITFIFLVMMSFQGLKKKIKRKRQHRKPPTERKLFLFNNDDAKIKAQQDANQHENMIMMMRMMNRQSQIKKIMNLVNSFRSRLDDLSESVNSEIIQLAAVANGNLNRNSYNFSKGRL